MVSGFQTEEHPYAASGVVVMGASAGGIQALLPLLKNLPPHFPSPIIVLMHLPPASRYVSLLPTVLQRSTSLQVKWGQDEEELLPGVVYVAPQGSRTEINIKSGCLQILLTATCGATKSPVDLLFTSAAHSFGKRSVAVVLSGALCDGAAGAFASVQAGGRVLTQIASEATFGDMPRAAMRSSQTGVAFDSISLACVMTDLMMIPV